MGSRRKETPNTKPVMGSKALSTAVFSPPIRAVPCWKNTRANTDTITAKSAQSNHPERDSGKAREPVKTQRSHEKAALMNELAQNLAGKLLVAIAKLPQENSVLLQDNLSESDFALLLSLVEGL